MLCIVKTFFLLSVIFVPDMAPTKLLSEPQIPAIFALVKENKSDKEIVRSTGISLRSVQRWTRLYHERGRDVAPPPYKQVGRKCSVSQRTLNFMGRQIEVQPRATSRELKAKNPALLAGVTERSVRRYLKHDLGYHCRRAVAKPWLTSAQCNKRLSFVDKYKDWGLNKWGRVVWLDEVTFQVTHNQRNRVHRRRGSDALDPRYTTHTVKLGNSVGFLFKVWPRRDSFFTKEYSKEPGQLF